MSRLAFTIGINNAGEAVILKDHNALLREHKNALNGDEYQGEYKEVFILETSRANKKKRFSTGGNVNLGAVVHVSRQTKKAMSAASDEMKGGSRGKAEGKVNFTAAVTPVAEQQGRKPAKRRSRKSKAKKTAANKSATPPPLPKQDENSGSDAGPSL